MKHTLFFFIFISFLSFCQEKEGDLFREGVHVQPRIDEASQKNNYSLLGGLFYENTRKGAVLLDANKEQLLTDRFYVSIQSLSEKFVLLKVSAGNYEIYTISEKKLLFDEKITDIKYVKHKIEGRIYVLSFDSTDVVYNDQFECILNCERKEKVSYRLTNDISILIAENRIEKQPNTYLWSAKTKNQISETFRTITSPRLIGKPHFKADDGKVGILDYSGEVMVKPYYDLIEEESGYFIVTKDHKKGIISPDGKRSISCNYEDYRKCYSKLGQNTLFFMINENLIDVFDQEFNKIQSFSGEIKDNRKNLASDYLLIQMGEKLNWIYLPTCELINIPFDQFISSSEIHSKENVHFLLKKGSLYGVVDLKGKIIHPFKYSSIESSTDSVSGKRIGFILKDQKGKQVQFQN